jgi:peptide/nickel transport system ATP-binding protein
MQAVRSARSRTHGRLEGFPEGDGSTARDAHQSFFQIAELWCGYRRLGFSIIPKQPVAVVKGVSVNLDRNETFALVGETGSGKSTIARVVAGLLRPLSGTVMFGGMDITHQRTKDQRRRIQIVFQNPDASLNPRQRVADIVGRPLEYFWGARKHDRSDMVAQLLADVRLGSSYMNKFPFQLSGGERQRVALARALAASPDLLVCDEILSALDVSVQAAILDLLAELRAKRALACLFITHDLAVVRWFADRVGVLDQGVLCETATVTDLFESPQHPYTRTLLSASPETRKVG